MSPSSTWMNSIAAYLNGRRNVVLDWVCWPFIVSFIFVLPYLLNASPSILAFGFAVYSFFLVVGHVAAWNHIRHRENFRRPLHRFFYITGLSMLTAMNGLMALGALVAHT